LLALVSLVYAVVYTLRVTTFDILVKDNSLRRKLAGNVGLLYALSAGMWVAGPLIAAFISNNYGINYLFLASFFLLVTGFTYFGFLGIKDENHKYRVDKSFFKNFRAFFRRKDRLKAYVLGGSINLWWVLIYLFMPLYIIRSGLDLSIVGIFLFLYAIPYAIMDYPAGILAGRHGYKKIFKVGFFITAFFGILCFFLTGNPYLVMASLVLSSFGTSLLEGNTESYFLDLVNRKEELRYYGPYNTAIDAGAFVGKVIPSVILFILPLNYIFLFFGIMMFLMFLLTFSIKNKYESRMKD